MKLCFVLHFYQPYNQQDDILMRIVNECYLPLTRGLLQVSGAKLAININGSLTRLLDEKGYHEVIDNLLLLKKQDRIEFTGSSMYHAFLPLLPEDEIKRQINLNTEENRKVFGDAYTPTGFFSPELAVNSKVLSVVKEMGFTWLACPELGYADGIARTDTLYLDAKTDNRLLFRNKRVSSLILSSVCRDVADLLKETQDILSLEKNWFCVMDAETFGHHRIGHEQFLFEILRHSEFESLTPSELLSTFSRSERLDIRPSTWSNEEQDYWLDRERTLSTEQKAFILWKDPENPIHALQWDLTAQVIDIIHRYEKKNTASYVKARQLLDVALSSDQYWWASAKPWWSLEMIEQGAYQLKEVVSTLVPDSQEMKQAEMSYQKILAQAFEWQRTGKIRKMHLSNSGTFMREPFKKRTPPDWFNLMILEFEYEMLLSAQRRDFEKAIKWRDALLKIKLETDIYDVLHVVDELWTAKHLPNLKAFLEYDWHEFSEFIKPFLIDRDGKPLTEVSFLAWKKDSQLPK